MTNSLDKLNLRPFEKRLVIVVGVVLFVVLNAWFVVPHFSDLSRIRERSSDAKRKLTRWQNKIAEKPKLEGFVRALESQGAIVPEEEQSFQFRRTYEQQSQASGVNITGTGRMTQSTNGFFIDQSVSLSTVSGEQQLVEFLVNLGAGNSLIRVRDLTLRPDQPRQQLNAQLKLVASYQKKLPVTPARGAPATSTSKSLTSNAK